jgi:hypothetical protein
MKNIKLRRRKRQRRKRRIIGVVDKYLTKAAKVLVVNKPIAIFYTRHGKS